MNFQVVRFAASAVFKSKTVDPEDNTDIAQKPQSIPVVVVMKRDTFGITRVHQPL